MKQPETLIKWVYLDIWDRPRMRWIAAHANGIQYNEAHVRECLQTFNTTTEIIGNALIIRANGIRNHKKGR